MDGVQLVCLGDQGVVALEEKDNQSASEDSKERTHGYLFVAIIFNKVSAGL